MANKQVPFHYGEDDVDSSYVPESCNPPVYARSPEINKYKVSIVVPTYNVGKMIEPLIESLEKQTMLQSEFEVIFVDDCSTDNTVEILKKANIDNLVIQQLPINSGHPSAPRNVGIEIARGKYIHFCDDDDYLGVEALQRLYTAAENYHSDVIFGKNVSIRGGAAPTAIFLNGNIPNANPIDNPLIVSPLAPHKMFRRDFINKYGIRFPEDVAIGEDIVFCMHAFANASIITVMSDYDYYYRVGRAISESSRQAKLAETNLRLTYIKYRAIIQRVRESVSSEAYKKAWATLFTNRMLTGTNRGLCLGLEGITKQRKVLECVSSS